MINISQETSRRLPGGSVHTLTATAASPSRAARSPCPRSTGSSPRPRGHGAAHPAAPQHSPSPSSFLCQMLPGYSFTLVQTRTAALSAAATAARTAQRQAALLSVASSPCSQAGDVRTAPLLAAQPQNNHTRAVHRLPFVKRGEKALFCQPGPRQLLLQPEKSSGIAVPPHHCQQPETSRQEQQGLRAHPRAHPEWDTALQKENRAWGLRNVQSILPSTSHQLARAPGGDEEAKLDKPALRREQPWGACRLGTRGSGTDPRHPGGHSLSITPGAGRDSSSPRKAFCCSHTLSSSFGMLS